MLHIGAWHWGAKYPDYYVSKLRSGLARNLSAPYRFCTWSPTSEDEHLTKIPGCFARLRTFDTAWQAAQGIEPGDTIVVLDLDLVVVGSLDKLVSRKTDFAILQGVNASNPCVFNGSVWCLKAGYRPDVVSEFSLAKAKNIGFFQFPDDQRWLEHLLPGADVIGPECGVYAFRKPGWPKDDALPKNACIVAFPGRRDPSQFTHLKWVREFWRE